MTASAHAAGLLNGHTFYDSGYALPGPELAATLTELRDLVLILRRTGGYMPSADQVALRSAMARLAAHGMGVEGEPWGSPGRSTR